MKKLNTYTLAPIVVAVFFGGILVSMALNLWITESTKVPVKYSQGEFAGLANPADIRGSYSLQDIEDNFGIPVAVTARAFGAETWPNPADFKAKDLETLYLGVSAEGEIGTDSVRLFVARYLGLPYAPEETTLLPLSALGELKAKLAPADLKALEKVAVDTRMPTAADKTAAGQAEAAQPAAEQPRTEAAPAESEAPSGGKVAPAPEDHTALASEDRTIKGKTTFYDLLSWGMSKATIEKIMGTEIGATSVTVRDFCLEKGLEFSDYRALLQEAVPAK